MEEQSIHSSSFIVRRSLDLKREREREREARAEKDRRETSPIPVNSQNVHFISIG